MLAISFETFLLAALIDNDGTHSLSGPLVSGKTKSFSFLPTGLKYFNIDILSESRVTVNTVIV